MATKYFNNFPLIQMEGRDLVDITKQIQFKNELTNKSALFKSYIIKEGDRPDMIAYDFYGSPYYDWVILLFNNITDPFYEWILGSEEIDRYIDKKYGSARKDVHHYFDEKTGFIINKDNPTEGSNAIPISNEEYEFSKNEDKRTILILREEYVLDVEKELKSRLS